MMRYLVYCLFLTFLACSPSTDHIDQTVASDPVTNETSETDADLDLIYEMVPEEEPIVSNHQEEGINEYATTDWDSYMEDMTQDFSFVIIISTKSYDAAYERAEEAAEKLGYPLDLRGLHPNDETGLSLPVLVCESICGGGVDYPVYLPRSDYGNSKYVSIEYSDGFEGFTPGYFIVVVASGQKGDPAVTKALEEAKIHYKDAYAKTCGVYMGCGC